MERMPGRLLAALIACASPAAAGLAAPQATTPGGAGIQPAAPGLAAQPAAPGSSPVDTTLTFGSVDERMTVPVSIGGRGPWRFVIDTGAERSVVSRELAERLGLAAGPPLRVIAMAGAKVVPSAIVRGLSVSTVPPTDVVAPALAEGDLGAPGMLGIDALQGHRVDIDFDRASMSLHPSRRHLVAAGGHDDEIVVVARSLFGQLIVTDARWRGRRIAVVIDTGSMMTVGNPALQRMMASHAERLGPVSARSATGDVLAAEAFGVGELRLGGIGISRLQIAIADAAPFRKFGLESRPAVMLGMDALRLFRRVRIDFANRAIEFQLPKGLVAPPPNLPA